MCVALVLAFSSAEATAEQPVSIGLNANFEQFLARGANVGWSRLNILWSNVNPQAGVWDFSFTDQQVNNAVAQGQQILAILANPPLWLGGGANQNIPPLTTTGWAEFARRVAQRYVGKIAAYEIWNEPDLKSTSKFGIGWGRNIEEPPLYTDFVHAAAVEIRTYSPGTLVVAPVFLSRNNANGADNRKRRIFQQIQAATYPDGTGPSFIDVTSYHNNAGDTESSNTQAARLYFENLAYLGNYCPALRWNPVWVTEYGWRSNAVGESGQREKICNVTRAYTGRTHASLAFHNITRAFVYVQKSSTESSSVFRSDNTAKPAVTQYLRHLAYPAVQNPAWSTDFPSCSAPPPPIGSLATGGSEDVWTALSAMGLSDPRAAIPSDLSVFQSTLSEDRQSLDILFTDSRGGYITLLVSPSSHGTKPYAFTSVGADWTNGVSGFSISGMLDEQPMGKSLVQRVSNALDPSFGDSCMIETVSADDSTVRQLGFIPPAAPQGFRRMESLLEFTRPTKGCAISNHVPVLDFVWRFENEVGEVLRAGIYNYGYDSDASLATERSLHWSGRDGARYWVATESTASSDDLRNVLYVLAKSMDPSFSL